MIGLLPANTNQMKKTLSIVLSWFAAAAIAADLIAPPRYGDPTMMPRSFSKAGIPAVEMPSTFFGVDGVSNFTHIVWMKASDTNGETNVWMPFPMVSMTVDAARSSREGGVGLSNLCSFTMTDWVPLSDSGTWQDAILPPNYPHPPELTSWQYGCYAINVNTDTPFTLSVGGTEIYIPVTNHMVRNVMAETADRTVSIVAEDRFAGINFGIAENPLHQFIGAQLDGKDTESGMGQNPSAGALLTNEWRMVVTRGRIEGNNGIIHMTEWNAYDHLAEVDCVTQAMWRVRSTFERNARIRMSICRMSGMDNTVIEVYGQKAYGGWFTDSAIEQIRDQDVAEMMKRGMFNSH